MLVVERFRFFSRIFLNVSMLLIFRAISSSSGVSSMQLGKYVLSGLLKNNMNGDFLISTCDALQQLCKKIYKAYSGNIFD